MTIHLATRVAAAAVVAIGAAGYAAAELKGSYDLEFVVEQTAYTGKASATPGAKGAFTAKFEFTNPSVITADVTGKIAGDSITYEAKYVDRGRNCTGTFTARGAVEKDGSKASGTVNISDSCSGAVAGTFRLWR